MNIKEALVKCQYCGTEQRIKSTFTKCNSCGLLKNNYLEIISSHSSDSEGYEGVKIKAGPNTEILEITCGVDLKYKLRR